MGTYVLIASNKICLKINQRGSTSIEFIEEKICTQSRILIQNIITEYYRRILNKQINKKKQISWQSNKQSNKLTN